MFTLIFVYLLENLQYASIEDDVYTKYEESVQ